MRKIIAITQLSIDGVMQAPGGPEEDPTNGFTHGGWAMHFGDEVMMQVLHETVAGELDLLLGRRTYEIFAGYWPNQGDNPIGRAFNKATKYVVTRTLERLAWKTSKRLSGVDEIRKLKASEGPELHLWGSSVLLQALIAETSSTNTACGSRRWCLAEESGCLKTASRPAVSRWGPRGARPAASSSTPTGPRGAFHDLSIR